MFQQECLMKNTFSSGTTSALSSPALGLETMERPGLASPPGGILTSQSLPVSSSLLYSLVQASLVAGVIKSPSQLKLFSLSVKISLLLTWAGCVAPLLSVPLRPHHPRFLASPKDFLRDRTI